jgi:DNA repair ATPase RecN
VYVDQRTQELHQLYSAHHELAQLVYAIRHELNLSMQAIQDVRSDVGKLRHRVELMELCLDAVAQSTIVTNSRKAA